MQIREAVVRNHQTMATLNVFLDTRRSKSGDRFPLKVRITHLRQSVFQTLDVDLLQKEWDEHKQRVRSNHPLHHKINLKISSTINEIQEIILDLQKNGKLSSAKRIKDVYNNGDIAPDTIQHYGQRQIALLKESNR